MTPARPPTSTPFSVFPARSNFDHPSSDSPSSGTSTAHKVVVRSPVYDCAQLPIHQVLGMLPIEHVTRPQLEPATKTAYLRPPIGFLRLVCQTHALVLTLKPQLIL